MSIEIYEPKLELQIIPPNDFEVGSVTEAITLNPHEFDLYDNLEPRKIEQCTTLDPHLAYLELVRPGAARAVQRNEGLADTFARLRFRMGKWRRSEQTNTIAYEAATTSMVEPSLNGSESVASGDRDTRDKYFGQGGMLGDDALRAWQSTVPSAVSLMPLANPMNIAMISDKHGEQLQPTDKTRDWLTACTDGQEIRNRSTIMVARVSAFLQQYETKHDGEEITVVSVAGGTALPTMQAIIESGVPNVRLLLLEGDEQSASLSRDLALKLGFEGELDIRQVDVFSPTAMKAVADELKATGQQAAVADAVGIIEYASISLYSDARARRYGEDYHLYNPENFIASVLELVDDEGMAIIGQMRADRPNPYFTRGVVNWPTICMRSVKRFTEVIKGAGVDLQSAELSLTPLGVYTMASIYKDPSAKLEQERMELDASLVTAGARAAVRWGRTARRAGNSAIVGEVIQ